MKKEENKLNPDEVILLKALLSERRQQWEQMKHGCGETYAQEQIDFINNLFIKVSNLC